MPVKVKDQVEDPKTSTPALVGGKLRDLTKISEAMVLINKAEVSDDDNLDAISELVGVLDFVKPDTTNPKELWGYDPTDIYHTAHSFRKVEGAMAIAYLNHGSKREQYADVRDVLIAMVKQYQRTGKNPIASLLKDDDTYHENATDDFIAAWDGLNMDYGRNALVGMYRKLMKHTDTIMRRWRAKVAKRTHVVPEDVVETYKGQEVLLKDQMVEVIADPIVRKYEESKAAERAAEAEKERNKNARAKGLIQVSKDIEVREEQISTLMHIEKEIPMQWNAASRPAIIAAYEQILEGEKALKAAFNAGRCNKAAPKKK
jgi:hypothetical protein